MRCIVLLTRPGKLVEWRHAFALDVHYRFASAVQGISRKQFKTVDEMVAFTRSHAGTADFMVIWMNGTACSDADRQRELIKDDLNRLLKSLARDSAYIIAAHGWGAAEGDRPGPWAVYDRSDLEVLRKLNDAASGRMADVFDQVWSVLMGRIPTQSGSTSISHPVLPAAPGAGLPAGDSQTKQCIIVLSRPQQREDDSSDSEWQKKLRLDKNYLYAITTGEGKLELCRTCEEREEFSVKAAKEASRIVIMVNGSAYVTEEKRRAFYQEELPKLLKPLGGFCKLIAVHQWPVPSDRKECLWAKYSRGESWYGRLLNELKLRTPADFAQAWEKLKRRGTTVTRGELAHRIRGLFGPVDTDLQSIWDIGQRPNGNELDDPIWQDVAKQYSKIRWPDRFRQVWDLVSVALSEALGVVEAKESTGELRKALATEEDASIRVLNGFAKGGARAVYKAMLQENTISPLVLHSWIERLDQELEEELSTRERTE
jgi:hypothetical protein